MKRMFTDCVDLVGAACRNFDDTKWYVSTGAIDEDHISIDDVEIIGYSDRPSRANLTVCDGDVIFAKMQATKKTLLINSASSEHVYSTGFCAVHAKQGVLTDRCLFHLLTCNAFLSQKDKNCSGATQKAITNAGLEKIVVNIPDYNRQEKITEQLDRLIDIIKMRQSELKYLDDLIKARFVELFGDLGRNDKGWKEAPLTEVCSQLKRYPTFCNMEYLESGVRVIRIGNILLDGHMDNDDENYVFVYDDANVDFPDTVIELQDIVMAVRGDGSAAKRIGIIQEDKLVGANISPNLIRIQANKDIIEPTWLFYYLTSEVGQKRLDAYVNKTAKKNIAAKDIAKVITPVPDMDVQKQYVEFVKQVDKSKVVVQKALNETQLLFDSLMQQYFG